MAPELLAFIRRDITIREAAYGKDKSGKALFLTSDISLQLSEEMCSRNIHSGSAVPFPKYAIQPHAHPNLFLQSEIDSET